MPRAVRRESPQLLNGHIQGFGQVQLGDQRTQSRFRVACDIARGAFKRCDSVLDCTGAIGVGPPRNIPQRFVNFGCGGFAARFLQNLRGFTCGCPKRFAAPENNAVGILKLPADP